VSVNDLLDILSNGNSPTKINRHMSKIFQSIDKLVLEERGDERPIAKVMNTSVGIEDVPFTKPAQLLGKVEVYLKDVISMMNKTLNELAVHSVKTFATMNRKEWIEQDPAQITLLVNNIFWSTNVE
jgi:dynein heavy chain